jgi:hypothetical protein
VSVDCTPRDIRWTTETLPGDSPTIVAVAVPLVLMAKDALRDLDGHDAAGNSLPVLGADDNARLAAFALAALIRFECSEEDLARRQMAACAQCHGQRMGTAIDTG